MMLFRLLTISAVILVLGSAASGQAQVIFYDSFEPPDNMSHWIKWQDLSNPPDPCIPYCGPNTLFQSDSHVHEGAWAARQEQGMPGWWASSHDCQQDSLWSTYDPAADVLRVAVWQFEDANHTQPEGHGMNHDQVQGWLALMNEDETEFFAIGVHAHSTNPIANYQYVSWNTSSDGWNLTAVPRAQGWRHLAIEVHPYTGAAGDVQFYINGQLVAEGRRLPGSGSGVGVSRVGLGATGHHVPEDSLGNTYEFFWYDELAVSVNNVRFDADGDQDVDQDDFGAFQACITGPHEPGTGPYYPSGCEPMDADSDGDVDADDLNAFEACASGPDVSADAHCDD